jgi:exodeoxyribonuclease-5
VLTATVRQASDSGILWNATWLRRAMRVDPLPTPVLRASQFEDVTVVDGEDLEDVLNEAYALDGVGETTLITRSNMRATQFNLAIRSRILYYEEELCHEDLLLVSKNNYYWSKDVKGLDFIANGDTALVEKVYGTEMRYDMRFADVRLRFPDRDITLDCKIMLDPLVSEEAAVGRQQMLALYEAIIADPSDPEQSAATRAANALKSPYINALQVKYAYAVTCHKSQGGQWRNVFIDLGYIPPEAMGMDFYRWLYTAITRATTKLYLLNPSVTVK